MEVCYQNEVGVKKDRNKASTHYQNPIDMGSNEETFGLGHCCRSKVTNTNEFCQNGSKSDTDKCKALIHYQRSTDNKKDGETSIDAKNKGKRNNTESLAKVVDEFKRKIKIPYELKDPERHEIADVGVNLNNEETLEKDYERPTELNLENKEQKIGPDELIDRELANLNESDKKSKLKR
ncbi:hypothetical protein F8M41_016597 [Gigaspora margarita]|uniref:Uncharacterized protein n=1 Tax=Gigaspora margarita TaxID=4874 RepID=A0A8H4AP42_GIGMA|nr:hypothetical protein F8M41_016597 [Gigaspora margarita]